MKASGFIHHSINGKCLNAIFLVLNYIIEKKWIKEASHSFSRSLLDSCSRCIYIFISCYFQRCHFSLLEKGLIGSNRCPWRCLSIA